VNKIFASFFVLIFIAIGYSSDAGSQEKPVPDESSRFAFAPEYHFWQDLHEFFNQKDSTFENRYFLEWNSGAELAFFSYRNRFFCFLDMAATVGLGRWAEADKPILFDPREIDVGLGPMFEYRFAPVYVGLGLDHHCFHQIDSDPTAPGTPEASKVMYWNKLCLSAASPNFRKNDFRLSLKDDAELSIRNSVAWSSSLYYSVHDFFGTDTSVLSWNQPYAVDLTGQVRCALYRFKGVACVLNAFTGAYFTRKNATSWSPLWNQQLGAELLATKGLFGLSLFVNWVVVDQLPPRQNKDKLIAVGLNGFN
jgi:hypothetical protein